ncbi:MULTISPECIES: flagellin [unclassified Massilia]|uniref:flagellin N-terminal helical domain-containing protein n=1 Tax=unclassified Massilia TaxID=2609279 RepID=UPI0004E2B7A2|nr:MULTISPECIES: flagellin [unclassified Massilia]KFC61887.1 Flagellin domain protein [Massilia sp. LC238]
MLSLHTNNAALSAQNSLSRTQSSLSTSMTRLSTGFRINSAMDDAAGLQIATRLKAQTSGMSVAMRNTQNSISMLQTAEGALDEVTNILTRMKDLATQAADGSSSDTDRTAMQSEYDALTDELSNIVGNTSFGGTSLLSTKTDSKLNAAVKFQIGASSGETMDLDIAGAAGKPLTDMHTKLGSVNTVHLFSSLGTAGTGTGTALSTATLANGSIKNVSDAIDAVATVRSSLGAAANRLNHVYNNLSNISTNTANATGRIMDVDFASESAKMTSNQMLMQAGTAMLKQSNSMSSMVMSLLQ